jgi:SAM-dependent methyltransferase
MLVVADCPVCGGVGAEIGSVRTINPAADDLVELRECRECGHWWHSPVPDQADLIALYEAGSPFVLGPGALESYRGDKPEDSFERFVVSALAPATSRGRAPRYLEIGSGGGRLLRRFQELGYDAHGVEPSQWVPDPRVYRRLEEVPVEGGFDVIVLQDVLEHVVDPLALMRQLRGMALDSARLFASFPCSESRPARRFLTRWSMVRPYGHVNYFSRESTRRLCARAGWTAGELSLRRVPPLLHTIARGQWRALAYEVVKGGRDQLFVSARAARA